MWWQQFYWLSRNCTNQRNHNQNRQDFSRFLVRGRGSEWMNEYIIHQHRYNTVKTVKSRTVSTGQKGSKSAYNCAKRYVNEETHRAKTKHYFLNGSNAAASVAPTSIRHWPLQARDGTGSHFVTQRPSDPGIQRPRDPVDPVTLFYNELQMSTYVWRSILRPKNF